MGAASVTIFLRPDTELREDTYMSERGEARGMVYVGEGLDATVWGTPEDLRRLSERVLAAADAAERLEPPQLALTASAAG